MLVKHLEKLGLSNGEAKVYLALVKHGDASASQLVKLTTLGRTNIYNYANSLIERGLINDYERNSKTYFKAEDPALLRDIIYQRRKEVSEIQHEYVNLSPRLDAMYKNSTSSVLVKYFTGKKEWKEVMKLVYLDNKSKNIFFLYDDLDNYTPPPPVYQSNLYQKKIKTFLYTNKASTLRDFQKQDEKRMRKTILVPESVMDIRSDIIIFGDYYLYGDFEKDSFKVTMIKDKDLVYTYRSFLRFLRDNFYTTT